MLIKSIFTLKEISHQSLMETEERELGLEWNKFF